MVGLTDFATLKVSDHLTYPGPGSYSLPGCFGPKSTGRHVSILQRSGLEVLPQNEVGPGRYDIKSTVGEGPKISMSPRAEPVVPKKVKRKGKIPELPKQFCMATDPVSPRYSLYGKPRDTSKADAVPGPGTYGLSSTLDKHAAPLGLRTEINFADREEKPGPGTYDVERFGDKVPDAKTVSGPKPPSHNANANPGPGAYDDPTTISARNHVGRKSLSFEPTFGGRRFPPTATADAPGPGTYRLPEDNSHGVSISLRPVKTGELESIYPKPGPGEYNVPTSFDTKKGITISQHLQKSSVKTAVPGPGAYDLQATTFVGELNKSSKGVRFDGSKAFDSSFVPNPPAVDGKPGPGAYDARFPDTARVKGFTFNSREHKGVDLFGDLAHAPGPGTYNVKSPQKVGTTFYKGAFSVPQNDEIPGPGQYDQSVAIKLHPSRSTTFGFMSTQNSPKREAHHSSSRKSNTSS
jgi:hypothetical protein